MPINRKQIQKEAEQIANSLDDAQVALLTSQWTNEEPLRTAATRKDWRGMTAVAIRWVIAIAICHKEPEKAKAILATLKAETSEDQSMPELVKG